MIGLISQGRRDDSGFTLVELLVAMGIFAVLLTVFGAAVQSFSRATVRTLQTSDQTTESRVIFDLLDKQLRSASAINPPTLIGTSWYVEYENDSLVPSTCTQWVLRTDTDTLATRSWTTKVTPVSTPSAWRTMALDVVNTPAQNPFGLVVSTAEIPRQKLTVSLRYQRSKGPLTVNSSVFTARNSDTATVTNDSTQKVCEDIPAPVRP
jgi:prepilin-type N-terminal cleavage/methylation domain-containing protein